MGTSIAVAGRDGRLAPSLPFSTVILCGALVACCAFFLWASDRGFDVTDDAVHLVWAQSPHDFPFSLSQYGFFWHPLYLLVGGDVALFRIGGLCVLLACATAFGLALERFLSNRVEGGQARAFLLVPVLACAFWKYRQWLPSPDYDQLNLSALMLFFTGLIAASAPRAGSETTRWWTSTEACAALSGIALGVAGLTKATSCAAAALLGLAWIALNPPRRIWTGLAIAAGAAAFTVLFTAFLIDGSPTQFLARTLTAYQFMRARHPGGDIHGIGTSLFHPFGADSRWRMVRALGLGAVMLAIAIGAFRIAAASKARCWLTYGAIAVLLVVFAAVTGGARALDLPLPVTWPGYRAWNFAPLLVAAAVIADLILDGQQDAILRGRRRLGAAAVLLVAPAAYSFGTDVTLIFHMSGAATFWAAAALVLASLADESGRRTRVAASLCVAATLGLLAGVCINPNRIRPLWTQTVATTIGRSHSSVRVDAETARYLGRVLRAAHAHGFADRQALVDISGGGPGLAFALGARLLGGAWLFEDGPDPIGASHFALARVPANELRSAWILTGPLRRVSATGDFLRSFGVDFPERYRMIVGTHQDLEDRYQILWAPVDKAPRPETNHSGGYVPPVKPTSKRARSKTGLSGSAGGARVVRPPAL